MYQTKLVLWRLLQNRDLFRNMRIGLASTFLAPANMDRSISYYTHRQAWSYRTDYNGIFKVAPFGSNIYTVNFFKDGEAYINTNSDKLSNGGVTWLNPNKGGVKLNQMINSNGDWLNGFKRVRYENGSMYGPFTGELENFSAIHGQYFPLWQSPKNHSYYEVPLQRPVNATNVANARIQEAPGWWSVAWLIGAGGSHAKSGEKRDRPLYKLQNRASLWVPMLDYDHVWAKDVYTMTQADKMRMWIDGVADIRGAGNASSGGAAYSKSYSNDDMGFNNHSGLTGDARDKQFHFYRNPELGVAGSFALAQAIFPDPTPAYPGRANMLLELDRNFYHTNNFVWFSKKDKNITYRADFRRYSQEYDFPGVPKSLFNAGSGEATGSVIDFFSP
jgi:hypothetical protein